MVRLGMVRFSESLACVKTYYLGAMQVTFLFEIDFFVPTDPQVC